MRLLDTIHGIIRTWATVGIFVVMAYRAWVDRRKLTVEEHEEQEHETEFAALRFIECAKCAEAPGAPVLCPGCQNNRAVINQLKGQRSRRDDYYRRLQSRRRTPVADEEKGPHHS